MTTDPKPTVLVTGAGGRIGRTLAKYAKDRFRLRLSDLTTDSMAEVAHCSPEDPFVLDVRDHAACRAAVKGCDAVVHLAGVIDVSDDAWANIRETNVDGVFNVFDACALEGVPRVVYASSAQTIEGYPKDVQLGVREQFRPDNLYGVCKVFGEATAAYYAHRPAERGGGPSSVCVRIANFREILEPTTKLNMRDMTAYISKRDLSEILCRSVEVEGIRFEVVGGVSGNRYKRMRM
ncbi:MAG: NAD(P)-dependent oxidoreductase, partial [Planctomycetota bacterium]